MIARILPLALVLIPVATWADAPPVPSARIVVRCAAGGAACVTIDRVAGTQTVTRGRRGAVMWRAQAAPPAATVSDDGRFVFEEHRPGGLVELGDGPDTVLLVVRDRGRVTRALRLRDVVATPEALPRTVSHRSWSVVRRFDRRGRVQIDLADGRRLTIDAATGTLAIQAGDGRPSFCRYAQAGVQGRCAAR